MHHGHSLLVYIFLLVYCSVQYNKLKRITSTYPPPITSIEKDPSYSHLDMQQVTFDGEYDEIASTLKPEHRDKQPASPAYMYADVVLKSSHQYVPQPISHDTPVPDVNVTPNIPCESRTKEESFKSNSPLFDDPVYEAHLLH